jgi:hypothetical protein
LTYASGDVDRDVDRDVGPLGSGDGKNAALGWLRRLAEIYLAGGRGADLINWVYSQV